MHCTYQPQQIRLHTHSPDWWSQHHKHSTLTLKLSSCFLWFAAMNSYLHSFWYLLLLFWQSSHSTQIKFSISINEDCVYSSLTVFEFILDIFLVQFYHEIIVGLKCSKPLSSMHLFLFNLNCFHRYFKCYIYKKPLDTRMSKESISVHNVA